MRQEELSQAIQVKLSKVPKSPGAVYITNHQNDMVPYSSILILHFVWQEELSEAIQVKLSKAPKSPPSNTRFYITVRVRGSSLSPLPSLPLSLSLCPLPSLSFSVFPFPDPLSPPCL
jgi:hypothetical protein